jgi:hypothetical protein
LFIALVPMLAASLLLTVSIGRASEKTGDKTPWKITGQLEEACSCDAACPCQSHGGNDWQGQLA